MRYRCTAAVMHWRHQSCTGNSSSRCAAAISFCASRISPRRSCSCVTRRRQCASEASTSCISASTSPRPTACPSTTEPTLNGPLRSTDQGASFAVLVHDYDEQGDGSVGHARAREPRRARRERRARVDRRADRPRHQTPQNCWRRQDPGEGEMPVAWSVAVEGGRVTCPAPCTLTGDGSGRQSFPLCHH